MKEATGEVSMTVITLVAIAVIGAIVALMWPTISNQIQDLWSGGTTNCPNGYDAYGNCNP